MTTTTPVFTLTRADGTTLTLPRLQLSDQIALRGVYRDYRKAKMVENLRAAGTTDPHELVRHLDAFDAKRLDNDAVIRWLNEPSGQWVALRLSAMRDMPADVTTEQVDARLDAMGLTDDETLEATAGVLGLALLPVGENTEGQVTQ